jgi:poly(3-hydroxybutyrate) depolymerase
MRWRFDPAWRRLRWLQMAVLTMTALVVGGAGVASARMAAPPAPRMSPAQAATGVPEGWQQVRLPATGSYFWMYVPATWDGTLPLPLVLFLHGAGSSPDVYLNDLAPAAEAAGCLVAAPKASGFGWGNGNDDQTVAATQAAVQGMLAVDAARVSIAGHSAGGAYAYLLAYGSLSRYSAVFSMSAPFYPVSAVADPAYKAPIHMYYGTTDPNYMGGAYAALQQQWNALGVTWESDVATGYGHDNWPPDSMAKGFQFLVSKAYPVTCSADSTHLCLQQGRFRTSVAWQDGTGRSGVGTAAPAVSGDSGVFWFFAHDNWEMLVKVINGCAVNKRIWVFVAATTDVNFTLTIADTVTGKLKTYQNRAGQAAAMVADTDAFAACP